MMVTRRPWRALVSCTLAFCSHTCAFSDRFPTGPGKDCESGRRRFLGVCAGVLGTVGVALLPTRAPAANLPKSTGADLSKTGTVETLVPILSTRKDLQDARNKLGSKDSSERLSGDLLASLAASLIKVPPDETSFKRMFDEYSDPVSYKQKFIDQNAFLVYYSGGFDGPNRPKMEAGEVPRQLLQYGARNDAWSSWDDYVTEVKYAQSNNDSSVGDILAPLDRTIAAFDSYLSLASTQDLKEAKSALK